MNLAQRIKEVMGTMPKGKFALACGVTPAAVTQWLKGDIKTLSAEPVALMEQKFGYRASWIVTGKGPKMIGDRPAAEIWHFSDDLRRHVVLLQGEELRRLENVMRGYVELPPMKMSRVANRSASTVGADDESAYADLTEEGSGAMEEEALPEPISDARKEHHRPASQKGRRGA